MRCADVARGSMGAGVGSMLGGAISERNIMTRVLLAVILSVVGGSAFVARAEDAAAEGQKVIDRAVAYLKSQQQANGSFQRSDREPPAVTPG